MGRKRDGTRIPTDGASRQGGGVLLGDLLRARGLVPAEAPEITPGTPSGASPEPDRDAAPPNPPAFPPKVVLRRERKGRGGRTVTRVEGLDWDDGALADLARQMARGLGCGAAVEAGDVVLQGDLGDRAAAWLVARGARRVVQ